MRWQIVLCHRIHNKDEEYWKNEEFNEMVESLKQYL